LRPSATARNDSSPEPPDDRPAVGAGGRPGGHEESVTTLRVIKAAQHLGFTLEEVAELLEAGRHRHGRGLQAKTEAKLVEVERRIADLHVIRDSLIAARDACAACCAAPLVGLLGLAGAAGTAVTLAFAGLAFAVVVGAASVAIALLRRRAERAQTCSRTEVGAVQVTIGRPATDQALGTLSSRARE